MARSRNIKPSFFTNETLAEVSAIGRLLFAGLWTVADREGRLEDRPRKLKVELLPYDECDIESLLNSLQKLGFIQRYQVSDKQYIQVLNFTKHQNPHMKEAASTIPAPDKHDASPALTLNPLPLTLNPLPRVEAAEASDKPKAVKGQRLEAFLESTGVDATAQEWGNWSKAEGMPVPMIDAEMAKFRDYWKAVSGGKGCKADWPATWRNWSRRALEAHLKEEKRNEIFRQKLRR